MTGDKKMGRVTSRRHRSFQIQVPAITGTMEDHCFLPVTTSHEALQQVTLNSRCTEKQKKTKRKSNPVKVWGFFVP